MDPASPAFLLQPLLPLHILTSPCLLSDLECLPLPQLTSQLPGTHLELRVEVAHFPHSAGSVQAHTEPVTELACWKIYEYLMNF